MSATAVFFVTHGSSDRRSWLSLQRLVAIAQSPKYQSLFPEIVAIGGGCLEGQEQSLAQQLERFFIQINNWQAIEQIVIMPLFLLSGLHVTEDIPHEVAIAAANLQANQQNEFADRPLPKLAIAPYLGTLPQIPTLIAQSFPHGDHDASPARLLIAHGSRRAGANQVIEDLAHHSQAIAAYWSIDPKIESQIEKLISQGYRKIYALPYFLTTGAITEAIAQKLAKYSDQLEIQQLSVPLSEDQIIDLAMNSLEQVTAQSADLRSR